MTRTMTMKHWILRISVMLVMAAILLGYGQVVNAEPGKQALGDIPLPPEVYKKYLKVRPTDKLATASAEALPTAYDARDEGIVTPAKNQGSCGSCWAFATVGAMESHLLKEYGVGPENLSEQQQVSCNTANYGCSGGYSTAVRYWEGPPNPDKGPLDEAVFPYTASDATTCYEPDGDQIPYRITAFYTVPATTGDFKTSLLNDGPSYWRFTVYDDFYTYWNQYSPGAVYVNQEGSNYRGGHAVLLIGWDDAKNAFLCKNSWGSGGPNGDGTFWIAYSGHTNNLGFGMVNFTVVALDTCTSNEQCDDGVYCNGIEACVAGVCQAGTPVSCADNGVYCDGVEVCDEASQSCVSRNPPCEGQSCIEEGQYCEPLSCGNGTCDLGENCHNCPDCISGPGRGTVADCFKGVADGICHPKKETEACIDCSPSYCCGDGVCTPPETSDNCLIDCGNEPAVEICDNGVDDDGDGLVDCDDLDCTNSTICKPEPPPGCAAKKDSCNIDSDCCSGRCNESKGVCL